VRIRAAWETAARRAGHIRLVAVPVLLVLAALIALAAPWNARLQSAWFDAYQARSPRQVSTDSMPATIVAVDERSLAVLGQWPWPRTVLAQLIAEIDRRQPDAIGIDILMTEPDRLSPERLLARVRDVDPALASRLARMPSNDSELALALSSAPTVLAIAGAGQSGMLLRAPPFGVVDASAPAGAAEPVAPRVPRYGGVLTSIDELDRAARGHGLISYDPSGGVLRRIPLVASVGGTLVPSLALEMLRVAVGAPSLRLYVAGASVQGVGVGAFASPTEADGAMRIYFSRSYTARYVSAIDVLEGRVPTDRLQRKLVLIGVTAVGTVDYLNTPLGVPMSGTEIHAQLLENLFDATWLTRPRWAPPLEALIFVVLGAALIAATPRWKPRNAALLALGCVILLAVSGYLLFRMQRLLLDAATPGSSLLLLFGTLLVLTLAEATRQKRALERAVQVEREQRARIAGELEAARRIQTSSLPTAELLRGDARIDLAAFMVPAREVGGDLYDFFRLDERRLFFLIGDVAGKGLPASIFMAVSKALYKSATLRAPDADIGELMTVANAEVSRDNAEMLFVTVFAGVLDLESGELAYCNAGHENPFLVHPTDADVRRIADGGGPPLCTVDDFGYRGGRARMRPGELLCLVTDGVSEAQNPAGVLYGSGRVEGLLSGVRNTAADPRAVVDALRSDVETFAAGAEPADDLTVLVLRWNGPGGTGRSAPV